jgi:hypothetical protein
MNNEFGTYELALALNELGYKGDIIGMYDKDKYLFTLHEQDDIEDEWLPAPLYQQAFRWIMQFPQIKKWRCNVALYPDGTYSIKDGKEAIHEFLSGEECLRKLIEIVKENKDE